MSAGDEAPTRLSPEVAAGAVLHQRLARQVAELHHREHQLRGGELQEGVHRARIACRRLRSSLATFGRLLPPDVTGPVREELRWLGGVLGDVRDPHVSQQRLELLIAGVPDDEVAGPVRRRLDATYAVRLATGEEALTEVLASDRHAALLEQLDRLVADPPWTATARRPAGKVLPPLLRKDWKRLHRARAAAEGAPDVGEALHEVRKAAKRLRYGAEALVPVWGEDAERLAGAARELAEHLGERQDLRLVRTDLVEMAEGAEEAGEPSRTWGALLAHTDEQRRQLDQVREDLWQRTARTELRSWLR